MQLLHAGKRFDVVLCDLAMPTVGGAQVYFETALLAPEQAKRFVFITGGSTNAGDDQLIARALQPTLAKPFGIADLRFVVDGMLTTQ